MPSSRHEVIAEMFRTRPELAAELAEHLGLKLPAWKEAELDSPEIRNLRPAQRWADAVVCLLDSSGQLAAALVVEVQLQRDDEKEYSWPAYIVNLRAQLRCPVVLLVLCLDNSTARWSATPLEMGHPDFVLKPLVAGPAGVPVVAGPAHARRSPELAVLSAMAHGANPDRITVLDNLLPAYSALGRDEASLYHDVVLGVLPEAARRYLEELMAVTGYELQSDFARGYFGRGKAEGKAEGEVRALLAVLAARGVTLTPDARSRITGCTDIAQLETWIRRAATAEKVEDLFSEPASA